ncbi:MAG: single-stranded DNA-binding protein [Oscillospiraceae bacterium]|nr:single-stranded DNA-binding protein [Oscillospiraceae bacterium]
MLNTAIIMGRLTAEPELKSAAGTTVCSFTVAVDGRSKDQQGERQTNFIRCVAWRERAEFLARYFHRGNMVAITGYIQVRNYEDKNGNKREAVEIVADRVDFTGEKTQGSGGGYREDVPLPPPPPERQQLSQPAPAYSTASATDFEEIAGDDDLPF